MSIKKEEQEIPYPNCGTDEDKYEFSMTVGKNLVLESGNFKAEYIETLWNTYNKNEDEAYEQQEQDVFYAILLIVSIYYKYTQTNGYFDFEDYIATRERAYQEYNDRMAWAEKMLVNIAKAGFFSSDRTIAQYEKEIWKTGTL